MILYLQENAKSYYNQQTCQNAKTVRCWKKIADHQSIENSFAFQPK